MRQDTFDHVPTIAMLIAIPAILYLSLNYLIINKYFPAYSDANLTNLFSTVQPAVRSGTTTQSYVQPATASDLTGKWNTRVGNIPGVIYLNRKENNIYGDIYYQGVKENLQGQIQGNSRIILRGTSYKRLKGRGWFNLDTFNGNITSDFKSIRGNYTDTAGHSGYWFAAKVSTSLVEKPNNQLKLLSFTIKSSPSGALVKIDRKAKGTTPLTVALENGSHGIIIEKQGYKTIWDILNVKKGEKRTFDYMLSKKE
ncbi:MAG: PEGA domain-containing protein [Deltaproteobacteria bacterium]|nr:PEGA domain-containing protein [Deltaproteobacteria bacterium]